MVARSIRLIRQACAQASGPPDRPTYRPTDLQTKEGRPTMGLAEVSTILWRERELLELLLFKLEEEQLVLAGGRTRWLARATREVEVVLAEIRRTELARATEVDAVSIALGIGPAA